MLVIVIALGPEKTSIMSPITSTRDRHLSDPFYLSALRIIFLFWPAEICATTLLLLP